jgi:hypothetical protein
MNREARKDLEDKIAAYSSFEVLAGFAVHLQQPNPGSCVADASLRELCDPASDHPFDHIDVTG